MALPLNEISRIVGKLSGTQWVVSRRSVRAAWRTLGADAASGEALDVATRVTLFRDVQSGRGSATFTVGETETEPEIRDKLDVAITRAERGVGPPWQLPPSAAPARVRLGDAVLAADPAAGVAAIATAMSRAPAASDRLVRARVTGQVAEIEVVTSERFANQFAGTRITASGLLAPSDGKPGEVQRLARRARRTADLGIAEAIRAAGVRLRDRRAAVPLAAGRYDLFLVDEAITADATGEADDGAERAPFSWFTPVVAQASAAAARQGLTRYQPGQSIFGERAPSGDPLTIASDGALAYGWSSRPFGELGEAVRRFTLVRAGQAASLALDIREAALRKEAPNGGVRNLVVSAGPSRLDALIGASQRPLEIVELSWLEVDPRSGRAVAEIALGYVRDRGSRRPVAGGVIAGNVFDWLARARLSAETMFRSWYRGPRAITISDADVQ